MTNSIDDSQEEIPVEKEVQWPYAGDGTGYYEINGGFIPDVAAATKTMNDYYAKIAKRSNTTDVVSENDFREWLSRK